MLYTKKGDHGTTKFLDTKSGERVTKGSRVVETLGILDELNSFLGLCRAKSGVSQAISEVSLEEILHEVQENLFIVQAEVAGHVELRIGAEKTKRIEELIDSIEKEIPKIQGFTIAGGTELSALLDVARTIARRAERVVIGVCDSGERDVCIDARSYLNRLSSLLFALARLINYRAGVKEKSPTYR